MIDTILQGDVRSCLRQLEDESVQCCITSPPYWGLRDYGTATWEGGDPNCDHLVGRFTTPVSDKQATSVGSGTMQAADVCPKCGARRIDSQIGLEPTPEAYVADLVEVFHEVKRVLRNDGTLRLNLGDSYAGSGKGMTADGQQDRKRPKLKGMKFDVPEVPAGLKPKDLVGIPWLVAFALRADGWYLRSDIIWNKPNPMPESVTDRCTKSHEYIFMLAKSDRYYYDAEAIKEPTITQDHIVRDRETTRLNNVPGRARMGGLTKNNFEMRNKRDVWTISTQPCSEAHFATFPPKLIEPMILAGTSEKGRCPKCGKPWERITESVVATSTICPKTQAAHEARGGRGEPSGTVGKSGSGRVEGYTKTLGWQPTCDCALDAVPCTILDPFMGSGTTAIQAVRLHRHYIGCELNPEYVKMAERRIAEMVGPLFAKGLVNE